jgi:hypothetical protein
MCDAHEFTFDVDRAFADQLVVKLEASPEHPLAAPEAPRKFGVYVLYQHKNPVYVGQAVSPGGVAARLRDHLKKIEQRSGISVDDMTCRHLLIRQKWEVSRAETALITQYKPTWQGIRGFSMHVAGKGRPGMPGYASQWDKRFPRLP